MPDPDFPPQPSSLKQALKICGLIFVIFLAIGFLVVPPIKRQLAARSAHQQVLEFPPILKGDPDAGEELFFNGSLGCAQCHTMGGRGGEVGPDLTKVAERTNDGRLLRRAILVPTTGRQRLDYLTATIVDVEGRIHNGVTKSITEDPIQLTLTNGDVVRIAQEDVEEITKQPVTSMPTNYADVLTVRQLYDLVAFLLRGPKQDQTLPSDQTTSQETSPGADVAE